MPASISAGDLLIIIFGTRSNVTTTLAGWTEVGDSTYVHIYAKVAEGSDTATIQTSGNSRSAHVSYRLTGAEGASGVSATIGSQTGPSLNPNPPSHTAAWSQDDTLWIAVSVSDNDGDSSTYTGIPTNYTNGVHKDNNNGAVSTHVGTARRELNATSDDPGAFTISVTKVYTGATIAIKPASVAISINVSDQLNITESVSLTRISNISVSDQLNITESVTLTNIKNISVSDQLNITENTNLTRVSNISVSDQINITENVLLIGTEVYISVSDQIDLTENTTQFLHAFFLSVSDSVTVSESVTSSLISNISVSDSLTLTENVTLTQVLNISVSESVDITESVERTLIVTLSVSDQINITESVTRVISDPKRGLAIMRGNDQQWPFAMDEGTGRVVMRGKDQQYPLGMDDSTIL